MPTCLRWEDLASLRVKAGTFQRSLGTATAFREKVTQSIHEKRCGGFRLSLPLESFGLPRRLSIYAGTNRYRCKLSTARAPMKDPLLKLLTSYAMMINASIASFYVILGSFDSLVKFFGRTFSTLTKIDAKSLQAYQNIYFFSWLCWACLCCAADVAKLFQITLTGQRLSIL